MAALNPLTRELVFKIVFYGPGLGGKTTTLQHVHAAAQPEHRGNLVSLATATDRTLYFDFLPVRLPKVGGMNVRLQLFTVPGQVYYSATRKLVLTGADGVVFVADSQPARMGANQEALDDLVANLLEHGRKLSTMPHTFQWNKRDLEGVAPEEELDRRFNVFGAPALGTVAVRGDGVFDGLDRITRLVLDAYRAELPKARGSRPDFDPDAVSLAQVLRGHAEGTPPPPGIESSPKPPAAAPSAPAAEALQAPSSPDLAGSGPEPPGGGLTFAALWPEAERASVRRVEAQLAVGAAGEAIGGCDRLVARALAAAAGLFGAADAPRDPSLVALLLGVGGEHYLAFRARVRAARDGEPVTADDALGAYLFAAEVRRRVSALRSSHMRR
jgi:signal recognition particle receptor subunit beta